VDDLIGNTNREKREENNKRRKLGAGDEIRTRDPQLGRLML
jgi:hypothetical protein